MSLYQILLAIIFSITLLIAFCNHYPRVKRYWLHRIHPPYHLARRFK